MSKAIMETKGEGNADVFSVLVVDDDAFARKLHEMILVSRGFKVQLAVNGKEAVDLHAAGATFDLILMDCEMPVMNGCQATKELRAMGVECPIVGVTARSKGPEQQPFIDAGLDDCIEKPLIAEKISSFLPPVAPKRK